MIQKENLNELSFFEWIVSFFKKKKKIVVLPTKEELANEAKWIIIKSKYRIKYHKELRYCSEVDENYIYVQYYYRDKWWYLRRWNDDYTLENDRNNAICISEPDHIDSIIKSHQKWIDEGHIFMRFDY